MARVDVVAAIVCDDIRYERSGKHILIGVYVRNILVVDFPAQISLSWWIQFNAPELGRYSGHMRVVAETGAVLIRGDFGFEVTETGIGAIAFERVPIQIQGEGPLRFEWQFDQGEWETALSIPVEGPQPTS